MPLGQPAEGEAFGRLRVDGESRLMQTLLGLLFIEIQRDLKGPRSVHVIPHRSAISSSIRSVTGEGGISVRLIPAKD